MYEISPSTSSPSLYSHPPSQAGHGPRVIPNSRLRALSESEFDDDSRLSMISGQTVRKYAENPWEDEWPDEEDAAGLGGLSRQATRMMRSAAQTRSRTVSPSGSTATDGSGSTRLGFAHILGVGIGKNLLHSSSGISLASTQTASTVSSDDRPHPITPKLKAAFSLPAPIKFDEDDFTPFAPRRSIGDEQKLRPSPLPGFIDRPLLSSGSPSFELISLEVAQERERFRAMNRSQGKASASSRAEPAPTSPAPPLPHSSSPRPPIPTGRPIATPV